MKIVKATILNFVKTSFVVENNKQQIKVKRQITYVKYPV